MPQRGGEWLCTTIVARDAVSISDPLCGTKFYNLFPISGLEMGGEDYSTIHIVNVSLSFTKTRFPETTGWA
jgi:hypothetical protein